MKVLISFLCIIFLTSCGNNITVGNQYFKSVSNQKIITIEETGNRLIYPSKKSKTYLFDFPVVLDQNYEHTIDKNGIILKGKIAEAFSTGNQFAKFTIPPESEFEYIDKSKSYLFKLSSDQVVKVVSPEINYNVREFIVFTEDVSFTGYSDTEYSFTHEGQEIVFIKNDNPVWDSVKGLDYHFYSTEYRDEIERDILKDQTFYSSNILKEQFANHEGYGMQSYFGSWFFIKFDTGITDIKIEPLPDYEEVFMNFKSMKLGRTEESSYENKLIISIKVNQENKPKEGTLHLIIPSDELNNIQRIISLNEQLFLVFRMGRFNDFDVSGSGIVYYSYDSKQLNKLLNKLPSNN